MTLTSMLAALLAHCFLIAIVFCTVFVATLILRNVSAHWRYMLWLIVLAKCFTPSFWHIPLGVLSHRDAPEFVGAKPEAFRYVAADQAVVRSTPERSLPRSLDGRKDDLMVTGHRNNRAGETEFGSAQMASIPIAPERRESEAVVAYSSAAISFAGIVLCTWILISAALLIRLSGRIWATHRRLSRSRELADGMDEMITAAGNELGIRIVPPVYVSAEVSQPLVWGYFRGAVYLPPEFEHRGRRSECHSILKHELAHTMRFDAAVNLLQAVSEALFFFHPLVLLANRYIRAEREKCCDEAVLFGSPTQPRDYCRTILSEIERQAHRGRASTTLAVTGAVEQVEDRIRSILSSNCSRYRQPSPFMLAVAVCAAIVLVPVGFKASAAQEFGNPTSVVDEKDDEQIAETKETLDAEKSSNWKSGQELNFRVVNADGDPIPGVLLELQNYGEGIDFQDVKLFHSDADGRAVMPLTELPPKAVRVYPTKEGYVPLRVYWEGDPHAVMPEEVTITMPRGRKIGGIVRNQAGRPIPDVEVRVHYWGPGKGENPHIRANINDVVTKSGPDGRWTMEIMPDEVAEDELRIYFKHDDYVSDQEMRGHILLPVTTPPGLSDLLSQEAECVLRTGWTLTGRVVDEKGQPVSGAKINDRRDYQWLVAGPTALSDSNGVFRIRGVDPEKLSQGRESIILTVQADGFAPELVEIANSDVGTLPAFRRKADEDPFEIPTFDPPAPIKIELKKARTARGRVVDTNGTPLEGVTIAASRWRDHYRRLHLESKSDSEGRFVLNNVPADEVHFNFWKKGYVSSEEVPISPSPISTLSLEHVVTMRPVFHVSGTVTDRASGDALEEFQVLIGIDMEDGRAPDWFRGPLSNQDLTVGVGRFKKTLRQDRAWRIRIEAEGFLPEETEIIRIFDQDGSSLKLELQMSRAEPLTGVVIGPDDLPLNNALVYLATQRMNIEDRKITSFEDGQPATTNGDGHFELPPEIEPFCLVVLHERGIAMLTEEQFESGQQIRLDPWSDEHHMLQIIRRPAKGQHVSFPESAKW